MAQSKDLPKGTSEKNQLNQPIKMMIEVVQPLWIKVFNQQKKALLLPLILKLLIKN